MNTLQQTWPLCNMYTNTEKLRVPLWVEFKYAKIWDHFVCPQSYYKPKRAGTWNACIILLVLRGNMKKV